MNKKVVISRIVKLGSLILAIVICVLILQDFILVRADHNRVRIKGYYLEKPGTIDVVLIGSSEVYSGFSSVGAYEKYGFTSYPYATQACTIRNYKTMLKEVLRTQNPKLIVFEVNGALYGDESLEKEANLRNYTDNIPPNENKRELVHSVATSDEAEYYLPVIKYHDNWKAPMTELSYSTVIMSSILRGRTLLKGIKTKTEISVPEDKVFKETDITDKAPLSKGCSEALYDLLDYCRDNDIKNIIFTRFPHVITKRNYKRTKKSNTVADIVRGYGYEFVAFDSCDEEIGIDVKHDFYNIEHMNAYGMRKLTDHMGRYLSERCGIGPTKLSEADKAAWDESVRYYHAYSQYVDDLFEKGVIDEVSENLYHMGEIKKRLK